MNQPDKGMNMDKPIISPDTLRQNRVPPGQRLTEKWPVLHAGSVPKIDLATWKFRVFGLVNKEVEMDYNQFTTLPGVKVHSDIHCVTGWSKLDNLWEGVGASTLRDLTEIDPRAGYAIIHAASGFTTNLSLDDFFQPDVLFAFKCNDETLTPPARLSGEAGGTQAVFLEKRQVGHGCRVHCRRQARFLGISRVP